MKKQIRYNAIIFGFLLGLMAFLVKVITVNGDESFTLMELWSRGVTSDNPVRFYAERFGESWFVFIAGLIFLTLYVLLYLADAVLLCFRREIRWIGRAKNSMFYILFFLALFLVNTNPMILILPGTGFLSFIIGVYLQGKVERDTEYELQLEQEKKEREERKRRLYFPGRYPAVFHKVVRKNAIFYGKDIIILAGAAALSSFMLTLIIGTYKYYSVIHHNNDIFMKSGMIRIFTEAGGLLVAALLILLIIINAYYLKAFEKRIRVFVQLGIRRKTLLGMVTEEYLYCVLAAGFFGIVSASILLSIVMEVWPMSVILASLLYLGVMLAALGLNQTNVLNLVDLRGDYRTDREDKVPVRWLWMRIVTGLVLIILAFMWAGWRKEGESLLMLLLFVPGIWLLGVGVTGKVLDVLKRKQARHHRSLLYTNPMRHRFVRYTRTMICITVLHILAVGVIGPRFLSAFMAEKPEELYPYDIVSRAYDMDMEEMELLADQYDGELEVYPMVCITSVDGDPEWEAWGAASRPIMWIQGQHIGISESTYQKLRERQGMSVRHLDLADGEWHIVYQQDASAKAQPIDWDRGSPRPRLRTGQPLDAYNTSDIDNIYPMRDIRSEEKLILTGMFQHGLQENIIVMSDEEFLRVHEEIVSYNKENWNMRMDAGTEEWEIYASEHSANMTEGQTNLLIWDVPDEYYDQLIGKLESLEDRYPHERDWDSGIHRFYGKREMIENTASELELKKLIWGFSVVVLFIMNLFILYMNLEAEVKELKKRFRLLYEMGMHEREQKRLLSYQVRVYSMAPVPAAIVGSAVFTIITLKNRYFILEEVKRYGYVLGIFLICYLGLWYLMARILKRYLKNNVMGEENGIYH